MSTQTTTTNDCRAVSLTTNQNETDNSNASVGIESFFYVVAAGVKVFVVVVVVYLFSVSSTTTKDGCQRDAQRRLPLLQISPTIFLAAFLVVVVIENCVSLIILDFGCFDKFCGYLCGK